MPRSAVSLARMLHAPDPAPADAPLLRAFEATRSDGAFEELVRRHGPMVLATCRRVLGNPDDAEDAFQAVFLVLARKANTVRGNLAGWLYAVSVRTARGVRIMRQRRRKHETRASARSEPAVLPESDHDLAAVLDEELGPHAGPLPRGGGAVRTPGAVAQAGGVRTRNPRGHALLAAGGGQAQTGSATFGARTGPGRGGRASRAGSGVGRTGRVGRPRNRRTRGQRRGVGRGQGDALRPTQGRGPGYRDSARRGLWRAVRHDRQRSRGPARPGSRPRPASGGRPGRETGRATRGAGVRRS